MQPLLFHIDDIGSIIDKRTYLIFHFEKQVSVISAIMSIYSPAEAKRLAEENRKQREVEIRKNIDEDLQHLVENVRRVIETSQPDKKGYYDFAIPFSNIKYHDWEVVSKEFISQMTAAEYIVQVKRKPNILKNSAKIIVTFRPK